MKTYNEVYPAAQGAVANPDYLGWDQVPNFNEFLEACKTFAADSREWGDVEDCQYYTTLNRTGWEESSDNAHGGFSVLCAFHREPGTPEFCNVCLQSWFGQLCSIVDGVREDQ